MILAEILWEQFLKDFKIGRHARRYCADHAAGAGCRTDGAQGPLSPPRPHRR